MFGLDRKKIFLIIIVIIIVVVLIFSIWIVAAYNGLVSKKTNAEAQWAQVENQIQRKIDLIPQIAAAVGNFTASEIQFQKDITDLRTQWLNATDLRDRINLSGQIDNYITVASINENYPNLASAILTEENIDIIEGTENRIAVERGRYNTAVQAYNTQVRSFPDNIVAGWFGFNELEYYDPIPGGP